MAINTQHKHKFFGGSVDWLTIGIWLTLCVIGLFNIYAAVYDPEHPEFFNLSTNYSKQLIFLASALFIGFAILLVDAKLFSGIAPFYYGLTLLLLVAVLLIGRNVGGNQSWIPLGSFRLQPSEFAKLATVLLLARYLGEQANKTPSFRTLLVGATIVAVPVILVLLQKDTGSALAFSSLIFIFYREGYVSSPFMLLIGLAILLFVLSLIFPEWTIVLGLALLLGFFVYQNRRRPRRIIPTLILFISCSVYVYLVDFAYNNLLRQHQRSRIEVVLGKLDDPRGDGYNLNQSKIAIGSGQFWGKGFLQGTQTKYNFVPEQSTDFIFCTVGEEWGFIGSVILVALYVFLLLRIIHLAERQRTAFSRIYAYGVASVLFFHFAINIGMTIGIVPVIGIPLPYVSYGGSSLWSFSVLLFILLKFDANRKGVV